MRPEFIEQYKKIIPLDRNNTLVELFRLLPPTLYEQFPDDDDWISMPGKGAGIEEEARRRQSENRALLIDRLDSLLILAPITRPFQAHILHNFAEWYIGGVHQSTLLTGSFHGHLFKEYQSSPGIFAQPSGGEGAAPGRVPQPCSRAAETRPRTDGDG